MHDFRLGGARIRACRYISPWSTTNWGSKRTGCVFSSTFSLHLLVFRV